MSGDIPKAKRYVSLAIKLVGAEAEAEAASEVIRAGRQERADDGELAPLLMGLIVGARKRAREIRRKLGELQDEIVG